MSISPIRGENDLKILQSIAEYGAYRGYVSLVAAVHGNILSAEDTLGGDGELKAQLLIMYAVDLMVKIEYEDLDGFRLLWENIVGLEKNLRDIGKGIDAKQWKPSKQTILKHVSG
jgi:hypothetical protein